VVSLLRELERLTNRDLSEYNSEHPNQRINILCHISGPNPGDVAIRVTIQNENPPPRSELTFAFAQRRYTFHTDERGNVNTELDDQGFRGFWSDLRGSPNVTIIYEETGTRSVYPLKGAAQTLGEDPCDIPE